VDSRALQHKIEALALRKRGLQGRTYPEVVIVLETEDGQTLDYDIDDVGSGEPHQIVIFVKKLR